MLSSLRHQNNIVNGLFAVFLLLALPAVCVASARSLPEYDILQERLRSALPSAGCIEASYIVSPDRSQGPSHSQRRVRYDVSTHQFFIATHRDLAVSDARGRLLTGEARFESTRLSPPELQRLTSPAWRPASMIGSYIPLTYVRAMLEEPSLIASVDWAENDELRVLIAPPQDPGTPEELLGSNEFDLFIDSRGWPVAYGKDFGGGEGYKRTDFDFAEPDGTLLQPVRSRGVQDLVSYDVTPEGCGDRAFDPNRVEAVSIELQETYRRSAAAARARQHSTEVSGDSAEQVGDSYYTRTISRWRWPMIVVGGVVIVGGIVLYLRKRVGGV